MTITPHLPRTTTTVCLTWPGVNACPETAISHELFGRCVHIVNKVPLFIGEGIKLYLCAHPSNKSIYILGKADTTKVFIVFCFCFLCLYNCGHWHWHFTTSLVFFFFFLLFLPSPHKQTVFPNEPLKRLISSTNLLGKLIPPQWLPTWFELTTNKNGTTTVVLYVFYLVWRQGFSLNNLV